MLLNTLLLVLTVKMGVAQLDLPQHRFTSTTPYPRFSNYPSNPSNYPSSYPSNNPLNYPSSSNPSNYPEYNNNYGSSTAGPFSTPRPYDRYGSNYPNNYNPSPSPEIYPNAYSNSGSFNNPGNFNNNNLNNNNYNNFNRSYDPYNDPYNQNNRNYPNDPNYNQANFNQANFNQANFNGPPGFDNRGADGRPFNSQFPNFPNYPPSPYERELREVLRKIDVDGSQACTANVAAQWGFETNLNEFTQLEALKAQESYTDFQRNVWQLLRKFDKNNVFDPRLRRELEMLSVVGPAALPPDQLDRYNRVINDMLSIYNVATLCAYNEPFKCGLKLQPDLTLIMARSRDWEELTYYWLEWRRLTGMQMRDLYEQLLQLTNKTAKFNNFTDATDYWMFPFDSPGFRADVDDAWYQIKPLYELLHAYVRRKLRDFYGPERISAKAPLPAHILGNMWGQSWSNILDITVPYPGKKFLDVTPDMIQQGYTPQELFRLAEDFYVSMNMTPMPVEFWQGSLLEQPLEVPVLCQPSAWDFCNRKDYRIKMCTRVTMKDLITAHHEMGHIQYFLHYKNQAKVFRDGANPGFHEAIGDAVALSVSTPKHLQTLGLVSRSVDDLAFDINYLYSMALEKLPFIPFALIMDKWRWSLFSGHVKLDEANCQWVRLRELYSGIKPPLLRSETDFDPGSKYHIPANIPYIRYFVGTILEFQIYRAACKAAHQYDPSDAEKPLHKCDFYRSKDAGRVLSTIMREGSSRPWAEVLFAATGDSRLDGSALRDYFRPLEDWLRSENLRTDEFVGWVYDGDYCKTSLETSNLKVYGGYYNTGVRLQGLGCLVGLVSILIFV